MTEINAKKPGMRRGRKIAAGALLIVGLSGATAAAAAQLGMSWTGSFQAGSTSVVADCQTAGTITTSFDTPTFSGTSTVPWAVANVKFSGIDDACKTLKYQVAYKLATGDWVQLVTSGTVSSTSITAPLTSVADVQAIKQFALTIYS